MQFSFYSLNLLVAVCFIVFLRLKRALGFQPIQQVRIVIRMFLFSILTALLLTMSAFNPLAYLYDTVGIIVGLLLTVYALRHISFEYRDGTLYYRTHLWVELAILSIFSFRLFNRIMNLKFLQALTEGHSSAWGEFFSEDPATMICFFVLAVYYIGFSFFILKKQINHAGYD
ncbi:DUF1453 family protein [Bacillus sp. CLL-7-23]|uniref:DUF1453 family protein n=1 Tax=Bacillus changyiensis TaxID=3004103 RepID=A0ABT4X7Y1_9BACI|nr:CcdC protein domain-containing protein [Bacillus changyiensis]MDA7027839.1 DUF1453 family protein [Bacillus changyiensis]